jgi:hypothetical protein
MDTGITKELKNYLFAHIFADLFAGYACRL